jgi:hypothetical protein
MAHCSIHERSNAIPQKSRERPALDVERSNREKTVPINLQTNELTRGGLWDERFAKRGDLSAMSISNGESKSGNA